ncbi:MAG TPA: acetamidase/formamidase family protein [Chloroflexota bacterium]|nr:acetamidase/formamidase family protein [Chloroflexota bacterium]
MLRVRRDQLTYSFSASSVPVAAIDSGDQVVFETYDASTGRIKVAADLGKYLLVRDSRKVNPAAGPIFVRGARPGDELVVTIERIDLADQGYIRAAPGGFLEGIEEPEVVIVPVVGGELRLPGGLRLPVRPMIGVIGTAPAEGIVYTAVPGPQGSNLDCNAVAVGAKVHLPVHVAGALVALGDVHAAMGDAEISGTGVEINAEVTATIDVGSGRAPARPWIETSDSIVTTASAPTIDAAARSAVNDLIDLLRDRLPVSRSEAYMLVSAYGDVRIGQACGGLDATVYVRFPWARES